MICCLVNVIESIWTGAMFFFDSEVNFIGSVSFEGNHANKSGGEGKIEDALLSIRGA